MAYNNIKCHKKPGFYRLIRKYIFRKTTEGCQIDPLSPAVLGLNKTFGRIIFHKIYFAKHGINMMKGSKHKDS